MASLVIQSGDLIQAASFTKRVLIGRKAFNGVQFGQRVVSRIHAWIDKDGDSFYIADARSRGGTLVNDQRIEAKTTLHNGDEVKIGPAKMTYYDTDALPESSVTFEIAEDGTNPEFENPGILLSCSCGAPMWVPASMAGAPVVTVPRAYVGGLPVGVALVGLPGDDDALVALAEQVS